MIKYSSPDVFSFTKDDDSNEVNNKYDLSSFARSKHL